MSRIFRERANLLQNEETARNIYSLIAETASDFSSSIPGQFVNVLIEGENPPLFRRPFSIAGVKANSIKIIYKVVGKGTEYLSTLNVGEKLDFIGPLGNGFSFNNGGKRHLLVGGGIGLPPLLLVRDTLEAGGIEPVLLAGATTSDEHFVNQDVSSTYIATDDGTKGHHGFVTELLEEWIMNKAVDAIYACGPEAMLERVSELAIEYEIPCQVSLERVFACGLGICFGCIVESSDACMKTANRKYQLVCTEGPVFDVRNIRL